MSLFLDDRFWKSLAGFTLGLLTTIWLGPASLWAWGHARSRRGHHLGALRVASFLEAFPIVDVQILGLELRANVEADSGRTDSAVAAVTSMLQRLGATVCPCYWVNTAVNLLVNAGRYTQAATLPERWSPAAQARGKKQDPSTFAILQVNLAEALHNLGRDEDALRLLARVDRNPGGSPTALNGARCLRAWIQATAGNATEARAALDMVDVKPISAYLPEFHYTRAALHLCLGDHDSAREEAARGLSCSRRASSLRNGQFLLGRIAHARGDLETARVHLEKGSADTYRGQGADGLLALSAVYAAMGRDADHRRTLQLVIERDAESHLAARALLGE